MRPLVLCRPEPGLSQSAARARAMGMTVIERPLFAIEPVAWAPPAVCAFDGLLFTSANAVRMAESRLSQLRALGVYAVGQATADAARGMGFDVMASGDSGVDQLLSSLPEQIKLLHLTGEDRISPSVMRNIEAITVYRAREADVPDFPGAEDAVIAVHSPRAAKRVAALARDPGRFAIAAISAAAARAAGEGWQHVRVADRPSDTALLPLALQLCQTAGS